MSEPIPAEEPKLPSDEFMDAVRDGGSIRATCELCGRECFEDDTHAGDWESGELEKLEKRAVEEPDKCIAMDRVETGFFNGKRVVVNCPCGKLRPFEDFIWGHRRIIMKYLSGKVKARAEAALEEEAQAEHAADDVEADDRREADAEAQMIQDDEERAIAEAIAKGDTFTCSSCGKVLPEDWRCVNSPGECKSCWRPF